MARIRLLALGGRTGTGKTSLAHALRQDPAWANALIVEDDQARRELLGYALDVCMKPEDYNANVSSQVRAYMDTQIAEAIHAGRNVIDCSGFYQEPWRRHIEELAIRLGADFQGLWLVCPRPVLEERIRKRLAEREAGVNLTVEAGHASDACLGVLDKFGDLDLPASPSWIILEAESSLETLKTQALEHLNSSKG